MSVSREVVGGAIGQGVDEQIIYTVTTTPWGSTPTSIAVVAYDVTNNTRTDVTSTVLSGSASVNGDIITTPLVKSLTAGGQYRIEVKFTSVLNIFECYFILAASN